MKRFKFRLESLLKVRKVEEQRKIQHMQVKQRKLLELQSQMKEIQQERDQLLSALFEASAGELDMEQILSHRRCLSSLERSEKSISAEAIQASEQVFLAKRELEKAAKNRQVVEQLRAQRYKEHVEEFTREESKALDEVGVQRHRRASL